MALTCLGEKLVSASTETTESNLCAALYTLYVHGAKPNRVFDEGEKLNSKDVHNVNLAVKGSAQAPNVNLSIGKSCLEKGGFQVLEHSIVSR